MKLIKTKKLRGFTLVELLVFTAVASIVMILLLSILISFLKTRNTAKKLSALQDVASYVFNELTQEIHWNDVIEIPTMGSTANELKLIQNPGEPTETATTFGVSGDGQLLKNGQPISLLEVKVNSFTLINHAQSSDDIPLLEIFLGLEYKNSKPRILSEHKTAISLRKKGLTALEE